MSSPASAARARGPRVYFELAETLANPYGHVGRAALKQIRLTREGK